jgi:hypothetical protein
MTQHHILQELNPQLCRCETTKLNSVRTLMPTFLIKYVIVLSVHTHVSLVNCARSFLFKICTNFSFLHVQPIITYTTLGAEHKYRNLPLHKIRQFSCYFHLLFLKSDFSSSFTTAVAFIVPSACTNFTV